MSGDIFTDPAFDHRRRSSPSGFVTSALAAFSKGQNETSTIFAPADPATQRVMDAINADRDAENVREEVEMDTPENRQKAAEAEAAERERKKFDFQIARALPRVMQEGWKHIRGDLGFEDEEIRVYTNNHERRRFWGIKPVGMDMFDFWEQNDPKIRRYDDMIAETWVNALSPPPVRAYDKDLPVIWAGRGLNPDLGATETPTARPAPPTKAATKPRKPQKQQNVNSHNRVKKSAIESPEVNQNTRKSLASKIDAGQSSLADQTREIEARADDTPKRARGRPATKAKPSMQDDISSTPKRSRGRPRTKGNQDVEADISSTPKRPRGRPRTKENQDVQEDISSTVKRPRGRPSAKVKPATIGVDAAPSAGRRGRAPAKQKPIEKSSKQKKKTSAVKGNARVTKSSQKELRPSPISTHKMRTRREGRAEHLQL